MSSNVIPGDFAPDWRDRLIYKQTRTGKAISAVVANAITVFANDPKWQGVLAFDEFSQAIVTTKPPPWSADDAPRAAVAGEWSDEDTIRGQAWLDRSYSLSLGSQTVRDAVAVVAQRNRVHPVREWLDSLEWDATRRVDSWLSTYLGCQANEYSSRVGRWHLVGSVARIFEPGCTHRTMLTLEGPQEAFKSTTVRVLHGEQWTADTPPDLNSKDRFVGLRGKWCVEWAELDSIMRADVERIKGFLSSPKDSYRPPYGRGLVTVPRQCVFVGTTNGDAYLRDETGNSRFLPVRVGAIDVPALSRDRALLWAEAREMYRSGVRWWPVGDEAKKCAKEQEDRVQRDPWTDLISAYVARHEIVTVSDILGDALAIEAGRRDQTAANRVARVLRLLGLERRQRRDGTSRTWIYQRVTSVTGGEP